MKQIIFFLKNYLLRDFAVRKYKELNFNQELSWEELHKLNFNKRIEIVTYAYNNSKFYNAHFKANGFSPEDLKIESDWNKVPVLTRQDIIENREKIIIEGSEKYLRATSTGGSSGIPLKVYHDKRFPSEVLGWRMLLWWGLSPSDNFANVYRLKPKKFLKQVIDYCLWYPTKRITLDASSMSMADMDFFIAKFNRIKPPILQGYVGAIEQLALYVLENHIKIHNPTVCWTTSSPITIVQRKTIRKAFNCDVMDQYGGCEVFWLAQECPHHMGLHVNHDCRHISILDENNLEKSIGELGEIAITDLENKAFPIIKYLNGDKGKFRGEQCNCGLPFPLLDPVSGRVTDCIYLPDKSIIGGDYLTTIFDPFPDAILGFQVYQKKDGSLTIYYIPNPSSKHVIGEHIEIIKSTLKTQTKNQIPINFEAVDVIAHERGKNKYIISEMNQIK